MTHEERQAEIARIRAMNSTVLSTPLMSTGEMGPAQIGRMSKNQKAAWMRHAQTRLELESRIRELGQSDAEVAQVEKFYADKERAGRIAVLTRRIEDLSRVGLGKSGKMRPTYQREIESAQAELSKYSNSFGGEGICVPTS